MLSPADPILTSFRYLGYLDDLVLVPAGIWVVMRLVLAEILAEHRASAALAVQRPVSRAAVWVIATIWLACAALTAWLGYRFFYRQA